MSFGERLKEARTARCMSQDRLAELAQVTKVSIIRYERHDFLPYMSVAVRLASALGVSLDWLAEAEIAEVQISIDDVLPMEVQGRETSRETPSSVSRETDGGCEI